MPAPRGQMTFPVTGSITRGVEGRIETYVPIPGKDVTITFPAGTPQSEIDQLYDLGTLGGEPASRVLAQQMQMAVERGEKWLAEQMPAEQVALWNKVNFHTADTPERLRAREYGNVVADAPSAAADRVQRVEDEKRGDLVEAAAVRAERKGAK